MNFRTELWLKQVSQWGPSAVRQRRDEWLTKDLATGSDLRQRLKQPGAGKYPLTKMVEARMASKVKSGPPKGKLAQAVRRRLLKDSVHALKTKGALGDLAAMRESQELAAEVGMTISDFTEVVNDILADPGIEDKAGAIADLVGELAQIVQDQTGGS